MLEGDPDSVGDIGPNGVTGMAFTPDDLLGSGDVWSIAARLTGTSAVVLAVAGVADDVAAGGGDVGVVAGSPEAGIWQAARMALTSMVAAAMPGRRDGESGRIIATHSEFFGRRILCLFLFNYPQPPPPGERLAVAGSYRPAQKSTINHRNHT